MSKNGNKLIVRHADDLGIVSTGATKLRQATLNLLSNAAKFTKNGTITLSAYRRKSAAGDWIEIQVHDTGIGIAKSDISNLFQNFSQASSDNFHELWRNGARARVEPKAVRTYGRRDHRYE